MKLFVWDYHGVLEQGNELAAWDVTNKVLANFGYKESLSKETALALYGRKWYEYFETALPDEPHERHLELQQAGFDYTSINAEYVNEFIKPNPYADIVLNEIQKNHKQIVISNTDPASLVLYLKMSNIQNYFTPLNTFAANAHSKDAKDSKKKILEKYLGDKKYDDIILIGDSPSDMALKEVRGGKTYLYCHPGMKHRECEADFKITDLREVLNEIVT